MEKQSLIIPEEIHLFRMEVVANRINKKCFEKDKDNHIEVAHKLMHNLKDERVKIELVFSFTDNSEKEIAFFQIDYHYKIENMSNFYKVSEDARPVFSAQMIATLLGISLSTSRGVIFERLGKEGIVDIILPVVSPQKMLV